MLCRVRVPRILIVLKGSQHGTHERYYLIYQGMGSSARALESTLGHTLAPSRSAAPAISGLGELDCRLASIGQKARHRPASSAASSAAAAIANTIAPPPSAAPRAARPRPACTLRPSAKRRSARPRTRRAQATRGDRFKDAALLLLGTARARELSASSYRCSAAAVHTGMTSGPPRMWRRGARSRAVPSPAHGRQSDAVQEHEDEHRCGIGFQRGKVSKTDTHWWPITKPGALLPFG